MLTESISGMQSLTLINTDPEGQRDVASQVGHLDLILAPSGSPSVMEGIRE